MPYIPPEEREALGIGKAVSECATCRQGRVKRYCRVHDEFFYQCGCPVEPDPPDAFYKRDHSRCARIY